MSLFNEVLAEFLKNNPLPKNKTALEEWARKLNSEVNKRRGQKGRSMVKNLHKMSSEEARALVNRRWEKLKKD